MKKHEIIKLFKKSDLSVFLHAQSAIFPNIEKTQIINKQVLQLVNECYEEKGENLIHLGELMLGLLRLYSQAYKLQKGLYGSGNYNFEEAINKNFSFFLKNANAAEIQKFFEELFVFESQLEPAHRDGFIFRTAMQGYYSKLTRHLYSIFYYYYYERGQIPKDSEFKLLENYGMWLIAGHRRFVSKDFGLIANLFYMIFNLGNSYGIDEYYDFSLKFHLTYTSLGHMLKHSGHKEEKYFNIPIVLSPWNVIDLRIVVNMLNLNLPKELTFLCLAYFTELFSHNDQVLTLEAKHINLFNEKDDYETKNVHRLTSQKTSQQSVAEEVNFKSKIIKFIQKPILHQLLDKDTLTEVKQASDDCDNPQEILQLAKKIQNSLNEIPALKKNNLRGVKELLSEIQNLILEIENSSSELNLKI